MLCTSPSITMADSAQAIHVNTKNENARALLILYLRCLYLHIKSLTCAGYLQQYLACEELLCDITLIYNQLMYEQIKQLLQMPVGTVELYGPDGRITARVHVDPVRIRAEVPRGNDPNQMIELGWMPPGDVGMWWRTWLRAGTHAHAVTKEIERGVRGQTQ